MSVHESIAEYLKRSIVAMFEDTFYYLGDLTERVRDIKFFIDEKFAQEGENYISLAHSVINDILTAINKESAENPPLKLGKGGLNLSRWHQPVLDHDPDFFTKLQPTRKNLSTLIPGYLLFGFRTAEKVLSQVKKYSTSIYQPDHIRLRHTYIVGMSGYGKTTAILNMAIQDAQQGTSLCIIAPDTDIFEDFFPHIPPQRLKDVVYINPSDPACSISLNPLHLHKGENLERKADDVYSIFKNLFGFPDVSRLSEILNKVIRTLMEVPDSTFLDIEPLLDRENDLYRKFAISHLKDKPLKDFWKSKYKTQFPKGSESPIIYRFNKFTSGDILSGMLCNPKNVFSIREAMDQQKIICVNLSDGLIGSENASMLGSLFIAMFQVAGMSRADVSQDQRKNCFLYVDEFQKYTDKSEKAINEILSRARKYGVGIVMAHQYLDQINSSVFKAVVGNCTSRISFHVNTDDAKTLSRSGLGEPHAFAKLQRGEALCRIGKFQSFLITPPPRKGGNKANIQEVIERSHQGAMRITQRAIEEKALPEQLDDTDTWSDPDKLF